MLNTYQAVVIGAGNGGLTAATALQRSGVNTLLIERHNIPGGCATSFVRGLFEFEVALHQLSGMGTEEKPFIMRKIFTELGVMDKVEFVQEGELYRMAIEGEFDITLPADWAGIEETLIQNFPTEQNNIREFMAMCEKLTLESFFKFPNAIRQKSEEELKKHCPTYLQYGMRDSKSVLDEFFQDRNLKALIAAYWCYLGMPPKELIFGDLASMLYVYAVYKPWHIKGGSQALSNALLESFLEAGGEVKFNCAVDKIITGQSGERPKVVGVKTALNELINCDYVVSNASSVTTFTELLDTPAMIPSVSKDFKSRELGTSAFCLYLGLDCPPSKLGITNASTFLATTSDEDLMQATMHTMNPPVSGMLTCYNVDDPSFAPEGKSQVSLLCLQYGHVWEQVKPEDYAKTKYAFAEHLFEMAEKLYPGIKQHIEEVEVATPLTMMRYLNTPGGSIYGFKQDIEDHTFFRDEYNQVEGLHIAGAWQGMGGFQPTYMAGVTSAKKIVKDLMSKKSHQQEVIENV